MREPTIEGAGNEPPRRGGGGDRLAFARIATPDEAERQIAVPADKLGQTFLHDAAPRSSGRHSVGVAKVLSTISLCASVGRQFGQRIQIGDTQERVGNCLDVEELSGRRERGSHGR